MAGQRRAATRRAGAPRRAPPRRAAARRAVPGRASRPASCSPSAHRGSRCPSRREIPARAPQARPSHRDGSSACCASTPPGSGCSSTPSSTTTAPSCSGPCAARQGKQTLSRGIERAFATLTKERRPARQSRRRPLTGRSRAHLTRGGLRHEQSVRVCPTRVRRLPCRPVPRPGVGGGQEGALQRPRSLARRARSGLGRGDAPDGPLPGQRRLCSGRRRPLAVHSEQGADEGHVVSRVSSDLRRAAVRGRGAGGAIVRHQPTQDRRPDRRPLAAGPGRHGAVHRQRLGLGRARHPVPHRRRVLEDRHERAHHGEGDHVILYRSIDRAGRREPVHTARVGLDDRPPTTTSDARRWMSGPALIDLTSRDEADSEVAFTRYSIDGGAWTIGDVIHVSGQGGHVIPIARPIAWAMRRAFRPDRSQSTASRRSLRRRTP